MEVSDVALGLPVRDIRRAATWYQRVFELGEPDLEPVAGVLEFKLGPIWLQLLEGDTARSGAEVVPSFGVADAGVERDGLIALGVEVSPLEHVEGAVDDFELADPDGNVLSVHSETG